MGMGVRTWDFDNILVLSLLGLNIICFGIVCEGGLTSTYVRNDQLSRDMPLDSDVFQVPPGYNAPQQVGFQWPGICFFLLIVHIICSTICHGFMSVVYGLRM